MKLENAYFMTQIFAGFAVILSLIFVGLSVQQNTAAIRSQEIAGIYEQSQASQLITISSDFSSIYTKSLYSPGELTLSDLLAVVSYISFRLFNLQRTHQAYIDGIIRESDWNKELNKAPIYLGTTTGQIMWEELKGDYSDNPDFINGVDTVLRTSSIVPDDEWFLNLQNQIQNQ